MANLRCCAWGASLGLLSSACPTVPPPASSGATCPGGAHCGQAEQPPPRVVDLTSPSAAGAPVADDGFDEPAGPGDEAIVVPVHQAAGPKGPFPVSTHPDLRAPARAARTAPPTFRVRFDTTRGQVDVDCTRAWAPHGADRLYTLVAIGFFDDVAFFRTISGFVAQFGIHGRPDVHQAWKQVPIPPDPVTESNLRGRLTFAQAGRPAMPGHTADNRTTQLFFNFKDNLSIDRYGFAPVCEVARGMDVLEALHAGYGEQASRNQATIRKEGNAYLRKSFPELDYIIQARIIPARP